MSASSPTPGVRLFITGMPRSGTTLLDKLLSNHPDAHVHSQPLPLLYVALKKGFDANEGRDGSPYPLDDMLLDRFYDPDAFSSYLHQKRIDRASCRRILSDMESYSGQYTRPAAPLRFLDVYEPSELYDFVSQYCLWLAPDAAPRAVLGSKETFCEEFIPYHLDCGARVVLSLRDPRDIVTSLEFGRGSEIAGKRRPLLWNLRQWRKGVSFALAYRSHPRFLFVRYEDVVCAPVETGDRMTRFLGLEGFAPSILEGELRSQSGEVWRSNSSHRAVTRIDPGSVGRFRDYLSRETDLWIQALCLPEMRYLGYEVDIGEDDVPALLHRPLDEGPLERPELARYLWSDAHRDAELRRFERLRRGSYQSELFLFEEAFFVLRQGG